MGDGRDDACKESSGGGSLRPCKSYDERWLERMLHGLHQSAVEESVPKELLDLLERLPLS
jgi:hypothetical protein